MGKSTKPRRSGRSHQPRKDDDTKRVNFDNERRGKFLRDIDKQFLRNDGNDVSWYTKNKGMIAGSSSIPFTTVLGSNPPYNTFRGVPGAMALEFMPNFVPDDGYVINQCAQSYYSNVVHANSRNQTYDPADLMIVTLAAGQVFAAIGNMIRAFGVMNTFSAENRYLPEGLISLMGFNYTDLRNNISHMLFDINNLIAQSRQLWIPNTLPIIQRWFWMNTTIYTDSDSVKPQMYLYHQQVYYKYSPLTSQTGGELIPAVAYKRNPSLYTWTNFRNMVQSMIDALVLDQDRGIMFGDILKCYGTEKIFVLNEISLDYKTQITYSPEVLWQIENAISGLMDFAYVAKLTQRTDGYIAQEWGIDDTEAVYNVGKNYRPEYGVINFHQKEMPTPEQLLVATRMTSLGNYEVMATNNAGAQKPINVAACSGTELFTIVNVAVFSFASNGTSSLVRDQFSPNIDVGLSMPTNMWEDFAAFDWCPTIYKIKVGTTHTTNLVNFFTSTVDRLVCEYDNYTYIDVETLKRLHITCIFSLFDVPLL